MLHLTDELRSFVLRYAGNFLLIITLSPTGPTPKRSLFELTLIAGKYFLKNFSSKEGVFRLPAE